MIKLSEFNQGSWIKQYEYKSFSPTAINTDWLLDDPQIIALSAKCERIIGELNAFSHLVPDIDFFIKMHIVKEATTSSKIEGTKTNIEEAFIEKEYISEERRDDWQEVQNYIKALNYSIDELKTLPLSNRLLKMTHKILLESVRGKHKTPGEFRKSQNWIGGSSLTDAVFIPPHHSEVDELMSDLEKFLHNTDISLPDIIRVAIAHYQFETIHPFLDGNGRIGRLLITLYLVSSNLLVKPSLYLSAFFEKNRTLYYDNLMRVRLTGDIKQWLTFFLVGTNEIAQNSINTFKAVIELRSNIESTFLLKMNRKYDNAKNLLDALYKNPIITAKKVADLLNISHPSANALIADFRKSDLLSELTGYKRNRIFLFEPYAKLFM